VRDALLRDGKDYRDALGPFVTELAARAQALLALDVD